MKILVPVDGSKSSLEGAKIGADLAKAKGAQVTLLAVIPVYPDFDLEISARARESLGNKLSDQAEQALAQAKGFFTGLTVESILLSSNDVADEIVKLAEGGKFDLIVMGSKGFKAAGRFRWAERPLKWPVILRVRCCWLKGRSSV